MPELHDGTEVSSDSEAWRHECEARTVLAMPTLTARRDYLAAVERKRGIAARERLQQTMLGIRNAKPFSLTG